MELKIGNPALSSTANSDSKLRIDQGDRSESKKVEEALQDSVALSLSTDSTPKSERMTSSTLLEVNRINNAMEETSGALEEIKGLRARQRELVKGVEEGAAALGEFGDVQTEISSLQNEIERVASQEASDGQGVLAARDFSSTIDEENPVNISTGDYSSLANDLAIDITTASAAEASREDLDQNISSLRSSSSGVSAAVSKSEGAIADGIERRNLEEVSRDAPANVDEAARMVEKVASEIRAAADDPEAIKNIVSNTLMRERVDKLVEEDED